MTCGGENAVVEFSMYVPAFKRVEGEVKLMYVTVGLCGIRASFSESESGRGSVVVVAVVIVERERRPALTSDCLIKIVGEGCGPCEVLTVPASAITQTEPVEELC